MELLFLVWLTQSLCGLLGWLGWLRLVRHVHDTSGAAAVRHLAVVASAYRGPLARLLAPVLPSPDRAGAVQLGADSQTGGSAC